MDNRCVICGNIVPEGTEVCSLCMKIWLPDDEKDIDKIDRREKKQQDEGGVGRIDDK